MKQKLISTLKKISSGSITSGGAIAIAVILFIGVAAVVALIPMLLIWGLQLMGFAVESSISSYIGSVLILAYLSYAKIGISKSSKTKED